MIPTGGYNRTPVEERILSACSRDEVTGCLLFKRRLDKDGYGQISDAGKTRHVHKVMWELKNGAVPAGMCLSHLCDEKYPVDSREYRACCEVSHMQVDTNKGNIQRAVRLGRHRGGAKPGDGVGAANGNAKLTDEDYEEILRIRREHDKKTKPLMELYADLAAAYDVSIVTIQKIVGGKLKRGHVSDARIVQANSQTALVPSQ
jgi:hypothetical protein